MSKSDDSSKEDNSNKPKIRNFAIAGAISGVLTRALAQPLDVVKVRFQLQTEPISRKNEDSKYKHTLQALRLIFQEEGIKGLWRGHVAAQALSVIYGLVQFQVYEVMKMNLLEFKSSKGYDVERNNTTIHFVCGGIAGSMATFASFPCDIIRTRLIAQGNNRHYRGVIHGITTIYKKEGVFAYFRGLTPALIVAGPLIGFQFTFYEFFKSVIEYFNKYGVREDKSTNLVGNLLAGSMAGLCSKLVTYPFDLARKRMQVQNFQHARVGFGQNFWCNGLMSCFLTTLQNEKFLGVYKGLAPSLAKATVTTALHFTFYEESVRLLNKYL